MIVNVGGRTDIVNYYSEWLVNRLKEGYVYSRNPLFTNNVSKISLKPEDVDCLMFCSKNYKPILKYIGEIDKKYKRIAFELMVEQISVSSNPFYFLLFCKD